MRRGLVNGVGVKGKWQLHQIKGTYAFGELECEESEERLRYRLK